MSTFTPFTSPELLADAVGIEQGLGRVLMGSITRIHDACIHMSAQEDRRTGIRMAHHHHVHLHGQDVVHRVHQGLPFAHAAEPDEAEVDHIGAQPRSASSKLTRVRVLLSKKRLAMVISRNEGTFLIGRLSTSLKPSAVRKMSSMSAAAEVLDAQQVLATELIAAGKSAHGRSLCRVTRSAPSASFHSTATRWSAILSTHLPT
jgi:hypothetical protein